MEERLTRRKLLSAFGSGAITGLAGCNDRNRTKTRDGESKQTDTRANTQETSVVFTDTASETSTAESDSIVFDGGDTASFITAIKTAAETPTSTLTIDPGTYRFEPAGINVQSHFSGHAELVGLSDVTIEGNGATFVFTDPTVGMLHFYGGDAITIRDLSFDYDPTPFTQAVIESVSRRNRVVTVEIEDGYPDLNHRMFDTGTVWASTHMSDGEFVSGVSTDRNPDKKFSSIDKIGDGRFELTVQQSSSLTGLQPGRRLVIVARSANHALHFQDVEQPTIQNVTIRASIAFAIHFGLCNQPVVENCTIGPRRDSNRLIGSNADGVHCLNSRGSPRIENCDIHHLEDDGIVVATHMSSISGFIDDQTVRLPSIYPFTVAKTDSLQAMSPTGQVTTDLPQVASVNYRFKNEYTPGWPRTIEFDAPVSDELDVGDYLLNEATANHGYTIRNNSIQNNRASLVRLASGRGELIDNDLSGSSLAAIELNCNTSGQWAPKGWLYDVEIANNTVTRSGLNYINANSIGAPGIHLVHRSGERNTATPHRNITIRDNEVTDSGDIGLLVEDTTNVTLSNNRLAGLNQLNLTHHLGQNGYGIGLKNVDGGKVSKNNVSGAADSLEAFGWRKRSNHINMNDNKFTIDGKSEPPTFRSSTPITLVFSRTVSPDGDSRDLAFMCASLTFVDDQGNTRKTVNFNNDATGVDFGPGIYTREDHGGETWRWFGGPEGESIIHVPRDFISNTAALRLDGTPIEQGITAHTAVEENKAEPVELGRDVRHTITIPLA